MAGLLNKDTRGDITDLTKSTCQWVEQLRFVNHAVLCYLTKRLCRESAQAKKLWSEYLYLMIVYNF